LSIGHEQAALNNNDSVGFDASRSSRVDDVDTCRFVDQ
jgi:hypothetical protein